MVSDLFLAHCSACTTSSRTNDDPQPISETVSCLFLQHLYLKYAPFILHTTTCTLTTSSSHTSLSSAVIILRDKRVALIDFGQSKELSDDLRHKLCTFYLSLTSKKPQFLGKAMTDLGIELDVDAVNISKAKLLALLPIYANGLLDTAPLPAEVDINPFSEKSPLQQLPIQKFNSDLFMVLRTLGLLRALTQTLDVHRPDCVMSTIFRPFALSGLGHKRNDAPTPAASRTGTGKGGPEVVSRDFVAGKSGMGDADGVGAGGVEQQRRRVALRAALTTGVSSPFDSVDGVGGAIAERCSVA